MIGSTMRDFTAPYDPVEAWLYDRVIAPAVETFHEPLFARFAAALDGRGRLLEVGCGGGQFLARVAASFEGMELTGIDLSDEQVRRARRRTQPWAERVTCAQGSALDLPFGGDAFDGVVSVASIKHWPDPARGLAECVRVVRPGGLVVIVEADRGCRQRDVHAFLERWRMPRALRPLGLVMFRTLVAGRSFDLDDARDLAARTELIDVAVERVPGAPAWIMSGRKPVA